MLLLVKRLLCLCVQSHPREHFKGFSKTGQTFHSSLFAFQIRSIMKASLSHGLESHKRKVKVKRGSCLEAERLLHARFVCLPDRFSKGKKQELADSTRKSSSSYSPKPSSCAKKFQPTHFCSQSHGKGAVNVGGVGISSSSVFQ